MYSGGEYGGGSSLLQSYRNAERRGRRLDAARRSDRSGFLDGSRAAVPRSTSHGRLGNAGKAIANFGGSARVERGSTGREWSASAGTSAKRQSSGRSQSSGYGGHGVPRNAQSRYASSLLASGSSGSAAGGGGPRTGSAASWTRSDWGSDVGWDNVSDDEEDVELAVSGSHDHAYRDSSSRSGGGDGGEVKGRGRSYAVAAPARSWYGGGGAGTGSAVRNRPGTGAGGLRGAAVRRVASEGSVAASSVTASSQSFSSAKAWTWGSQPSRLAPKKSERQASSVKEDDDLDSDEDAPGLGTGRGLVRKERENPYEQVEELVRNVIDNMKRVDKTDHAMASLTLIARESNQARAQLRDAANSSRVQADLDELHQQAVMCTEVGRAGGVNAFVRAMKYHKHSRRVILRGLQGLVLLLEDAENRATFHARGGHELLKLLRGLYKRDKEIKRWISAIQRLPGVGGGGCLAFLSRCR